MKGQRKSPELSAGSMADIAFLLLIFFLVTTTIIEDKGILTKLPPYPEFPDQPPTPVDEEFVLNVALNKFDEVLFEKEIVQIEQVNRLTKRFFQDRMERPKNKQIIVALNCSRSTTYNAYIDLYDRLKQVYHEMWNDIAMRKFKKTYNQATKLERKVVRNELPMVISESDMKPE